MGLDMYAFAFERSLLKNPDAQTDLETSDGSDDFRRPPELAYWRKFNALHGWMEDLYYAKGGTAASFNCATVRLTAADLDTLEEVLDNNRLKPVQGFFFGEQTIYPEDVADTRDFIAKARAALAQGKVVAYDSWW